MGFVLQIGDLLICFVKFVIQSILQLENAYAIIAVGKRIETDIVSLRTKTPRARNTWGFLFHLELAYYSGLLPSDILSSHLHM